VEHLFFECSVRAELIIGAAAIVLSTMKAKEPAAKHLSGTFSNFSARP
jgi:hypothetical protein